MFLGQFKIASKWGQIFLRSLTLNADVSLRVNYDVTGAFTLILMNQIVF